MEEDEYTATYNEIAANRCEFEKTLTNNLGRCELSNHFCLADREGYACNSTTSAGICREYLEKLRNKSRFLLKLQRPNEPLPHNMEIRVQTGGLKGLAKVLSTENELPPQENITLLMEQAISQFGSINELPYSEIIQSIAEIKTRKRSRQKNK